MQCFLVFEIASSWGTPRLNETGELSLVNHLFGKYNNSLVRPVINSSEPIKVQFQMKLSRLVNVVSFYDTKHKYTEKRINKLL